MHALNPVDTSRLLATLRAAARLARSGQLPFAARLVGADGGVCLEAENEVQRRGDPTAHAEIVLIREAARRFADGSFAAMTVYTAAEPCGMCAGALILTGIGRVVYSLSARRLAPHVELPPVVVPGVSGRAMLDATADGPSVLGPALEDEAIAHLFGRE